MRIYSTLPKEIKINDFLVQKLTEKLGSKVNSFLIEIESLTKSLFDNLKDFQYVVEQLEYT